MYFSLIPDIKQPVRPISFPFSESEYITAKISSEDTKSTQTSLSMLYTLRSMQ